MARESSRRTLSRRAHGSGAVLWNGDPASPWLAPACGGAGHAGFQRGDFFGAVDDYEQRWMVENALPRRHTSIQPWEGEMFSVCLLLWSEQGLGDENFFLVLLSHVGELHSCDVAEVDRRLLPLFSRSFQEVPFLEKGSGCIGPLDDQRALPFASMLRVLVRSGFSLPVRLDQ